MRALLLRADGRVGLEETLEPTAAEECLIRVTRAGICGTDLQMMQGYADFTGILGHEFVGIVEHAPPADARWIGKRVVGEINVGCGTCRWCARGVKEHCRTRTVVGIRGRAGAFAEYLTLPAINLHEVPDSMGNDTAVFVEPVAAACRILEQVPVTPTTTVAIIGDGRLGNVTAQVLRTRTPHVVLFGRHEHKLAVARAMGIEARASGGSSTYDLVVDASGRPDGLTRALERVEPRGTIVLKSTCHDVTATPLWPVPVHEVTIVGSRCGPFAPALTLLASGAVRTDLLVAHTFDLADYEEAFAAARQSMKILLDPAARARRHDRIGKTHVRRNA
jgi:threonine dehydrogenase-like Zn-dependent dehydrogenase